MSNKKDNLSKKINDNTKKGKEKTKKAIEEYKKFAIKGNAMDLAIGVVLGSAFTNIVNTIVSSTITPVLSILTSKVKLSNLFVSLTGGEYSTLEEATSAGAITLNYGMLIESILNFFIVSLVLFAIVSFIRKSTAKKDAEEDTKKKETTKTCPYCMSTIPIEATRCAHCTSELPKETKKEKK